MTNMTEDTKAIILLCGNLGNDRNLLPLSQNEYTALVVWLIAQQLRPADLLRPDHLPSAALASGIAVERLKALLERGVQLGFTVEEWERSGTWVLSRSDERYPVRYKKQLKDQAPPLLFGTGNIELLSRGGMVITGTANLNAESELFARNLAQRCANENIQLISTGNRGIDRLAMDSALDAGGSVVAILTEKLLKSSVDRANRHAIAAGRLLLLSPYPPETGFTAGTATERHKLIYALADFALVVNTENKKGSAWEGAVEELTRNPHIPVFVHGNSKLLESGAIPCPIFDASSLTEQLTATVTATRTTEEI